MPVDGKLQAVQIVQHQGMTVGHFQLWKWQHFSLFGDKTMTTEKYAFQKWQWQVLSLSVTRQNDNKNLIVMPNPEFEFE